MGSKIILIGFVQSLLLRCNDMQLILLIFIKFIVLLLICIKPKLIKRTLIKILTIVHYITSLSIDIILILSKSGIISKLIEVHSIRS